MRTLSAFNFITLDAYYKGPHEDTSWHVHGGEESEFSEEALKAGNTLLLGRHTYDMMVSFWPTTAAIMNMPIIAEGMNNAEKIVFSKTMKKAGWNNTTIIKDNIAEEIKKLKQQPGSNMTILGSSSIITQFADQSLIDEYQFMIDPVAIGEGTSIFKGLKNKLNLKLTATRTFKSGVVLLTYQPQ